MSGAYLPLLHQAVKVLGAPRVREARYGRELWSWFVALALLLLVAETLLARWGLGDARLPEPAGS